MCSKSRVDIPYINTLPTFSGFGSPCGLLITIGEGVNLGRSISCISRNSVSELTILVSSLSFSFPLHLLPLLPPSLWY